MTTPVFDLVAYPSIYTLTGQPLRATWPELVESFSRHLRLTVKDTAPGFGPYRMRPLAEVADVSCGNPRHPRGHHRCDSCVEALSLAVFDVDCGTTADVERTDRLLAPFARLWYSSFSFDPAAEKPALRLIVPLASPVEASRWSSWRESFIRAYSVPADVRKCGGLSHFYYAPSCPPSVEPVLDVHDGVFFDPSTVPSTARRRSATVHLVSDALDLDAPVDVQRLANHRLRLKQSLAGFKRSSKPDAEVVAQLLEKMLAGQPLAEHGSRNTSTTRLVFHLVRKLGDLTLAEGMALVDPSLEAMMAEGSSLTRLTVARMFETAFQKVEAQKARDREIEDLLLERVGMSRTSIRS